MNILKIKINQEIKIIFKIKLLDYNKMNMLNNTKKAYNKKINNALFKIAPQL